MLSNLISEYFDIGILSLSANNGYFFKMFTHYFSL